MNREKKLESINKAILKIEKLYSNCVLCGHKCHCDRLNGFMGKCSVKEKPDKIKIASKTLHFGEEPMLVGVSGSGTVFFSSCNLRCVYCQNYQISSEGLGDDISIEELASYFLDLQKLGANNINLVTPTHVIYQIVLALKIAFENGLDIPIAYNTNGFDSVELIEALDGVIDIYLPDMKYYKNENAKKFSNASNYFSNAINAIKLMHAQVKDFVYDDYGILKRGLIVRHLILPNNISGIYDILIELKNNDMCDVILSLMSQYSPQYQALNYEELSSPITKKEYDEIIDYAASLGFENILAQEFESQSNYLPDFNNNENPFKI